RGEAVREGPTEAYAAYAAGRADRANEAYAPLSSAPRSAADFADEMAQLRQQQLVEGEPAGVGRARERHDDAAGVDAHLRARKHRGDTDLLVGEDAEELAEARQALVEQRRHRLERRVARRDAGAAPALSRAGGRGRAHPRGAAPGPLGGGCGDRPRSAGCSRDSR